MAEDKTTEETPKAVEVPDVSEVKGKTPVALSDLAEGGFSPQELEMAKKQGIVQVEDSGSNNGDEPANKGDKPAKDLVIPSKKERGDKDGKDESSGKKEEVKKAKTIDERFKVLAEGKSPEAIIAEVAEQGDLTPGQEKALISSLTQNGKTLYWSQKKERQKRQVAEARAKEVDDALSKANARIAELEKAPKQKKEEDPLGLETEEVEVVDPKKKPLTEEDLDRREKEKNTQAEEQSKKRTERAQIITEALDDQQAEAKERYDDFDVAVEHTQEILTLANSGHLEDIYPDPRERSRVERDLLILLNAYANADKFEPGKFNAADMTYELGKNHPKFGKTNQKKDPPNKASGAGETDADGNPETVSRVITNANRRGSSAALNGGGSRSAVNLEDLTEEQAARLPMKQFNKLPKDVRERLLGKS